MKRAWAISVILFLCVGIYLFVSYERVVYGNNEKSIIEVIRSIEVFEEQATIEVLNVIDIDDERVVGFLHNGAPSCVQFTKDEKNNYKWNAAQKNEGKSVAAFCIVINGEDQTLKFLQVSNGKNDIARIKVTINNGISEQEINVGEKAAFLFDSLTYSENQGTFEDEFYDQNGQRIEWEKL